MGRLNTVRPVAKVVDLLLGGYFSDSLDICHSVGQKALSIYSQLAISPSVQSVKPYKAVTMQ